MTWVKWMLVLYGLLNIALGVTAFIRTESMISLAGGAGAGVVILIATAISFRSPRVGYIIALLVAIGLTGRFLPSYFRTGEAYPNLVIATASIVVIVGLLAGHLLAQRKKAAA